MATRPHYRTTDAVVFIFDTTHRPSFTALSEWKALVDGAATRPFDGVVVGAKSDLDKSRVSCEVKPWHSLASHHAAHHALAPAHCCLQVVTKVEAILFAASLGMGYLEASAVEDTGVTEAFRHVIELAASRLLIDGAGRRAAAAAAESVLLTAEERGAAPAASSCCGGV